MGAYIIIGGLLLWILIDSKIRWWIKAITIPLGIWFGFVVWFVPCNLMGLPFSTLAEKIPGNEIVKDIIINEPSESDKGGIYFWLIPLPIEIEEILLNPKTLSKYSPSMFEPRSYKIPYNKELHKKLLEAQEEKSKIRGGILIFKGLLGKGKKAQREGGAEGDSMFRLIDPREVLQKENG